VKVFKTFDEQIVILKDDKKLIINDEEKAKSILMKENYYNMINGYSDLFIIPNSSPEEFISGTTFDEIYILYEFDRHLRNIIFAFILKVESVLRTQIAYTFSKYHGIDNYFKYDNFETFIGTNTAKKTINNQAKKIHSLISKLQSDISKSIDTKEYIKHYIIDHGYIPLWVLVNAMPLGTLSKFYTLMKQNERVEISKYWEMAEQDLGSCIKSLAFYRNLCAHDERVFNSKSGIIPNTSIHNTLNIPIVKGEYICGKKDVFSLVIVLKILLSDDEFRTFYNKVNGRIVSLSGKISTSYLTNVLNEMGFPSNWKDIRNI